MHNLNDDEQSWIQIFLCSPVLKHSCYVKLEHKRGPACARFLGGLWEWKHLASRWAPSAPRDLQRPVNRGCVRAYPPSLTSPAPATKTAKLQWGGRTTSAHTLTHRRVTGEVGAKLQRKMFSISWWFKPVWMRVKFRNEIFKRNPKRIQLRIFSPSLSSCRLRAIPVLGRWRWPNFTSLDPVV